jgi:hypothetical protein
MTREEKIIEARAKRDKGHFDQLVIERVPRDLFHDHVSLACGHSSLGYPPLDPEKEDKATCLECAKAFLEPQP